MAKFKNKRTNCFRIIRISLLPPPAFHIPEKKVKAGMTPGSWDFNLLKIMCQKIPAFLPRSHRGFGGRNTELLRQGTFVSSVKSQPLKVALLKFILKAGWRRALAALWLNNSYYLPSFREAAECQGINIWGSREICPSTTGEGRGASSRELCQTCTFCWLGGLKDLFKIPAWRRNLKYQFKGPV